MHYRTGLDSLRKANVVTRKTINLTENNPEETQNLPKFWQKQYTETDARTD